MEIKLNVEIRQRLATLLYGLFRGDAGRANGELRACVEGLGDAARYLSSETAPQARFVDEVIDALVARSLLRDFYLRLCQTRPAARDAINGVFIPLLCHLACQSDNVPQPTGTTIDALLREVKTTLTQQTCPLPNLTEWLNTFFPGHSPNTPDLPPVIYLAIFDNKLSFASIRTASYQDVNRTPAEIWTALRRPVPPDPIAGTDIAQIVRYLTDNLPSQLRHIERDQFVLVIQAPPECLEIRPHQVQVPSTDLLLNEALAAVTWWPEIHDLPVSGREHDGDIPSPTIDSSVAVWRCVPGKPERRAASLGVWVAPGIWQARSTCPIVAQYDKRYFAVLFESEPDSYQIDRMSLSSLFNLVRSNATLIWTDRRFHREDGVYLP